MGEIWERDLLLSLLSLIISVHSSVLMTAMNFGIEKPINSMGLWILIETYSFLDVQRHHCTFQLRHQLGNSPVHKRHH